MAFLRIPGELGFALTRSCTKQRACLCDCTSFATPGSGPHDCFNRGIVEGLTGGTCLTGGMDVDSFGTISSNGCRARPPDGTEQLHLALQIRVDRQLTYQV